MAAFGTKAEVAGWDHTLSDRRTTKIALNSIAACLERVADWVSRVMEMTSRRWRGMGRDDCRVAAPASSGRSCTRCPAAARVHNKANRRLPQLPGAASAAVPHPTPSPSHGHACPPGPPSCPIRVASRPGLPAAWRTSWGATAGTATCVPFLVPFPVCVPVPLYVVTSVGICIRRHARRCSRCRCFRRMRWPR